MAVVAVAPVAAQDKIDIPVWVAFTDNRLDWAKEKAAAFNEAFPQYNVIVEGYPTYEDLFTATNLAAEQNSLPAIVQYFEAATTDARDSGLYTSIADALGDRTEVNGIAANFDDIIGPVAAYYTLDGKFTSMPWNTSSAIMFSNKNILDAAGIETVPATWQDIEAACETIMAMDGAPEYCFTFPNHGWFFEQWLASQNGVFGNNDNGRSARATEVAFNSPEGVNILNWLDDMQAKGYLYYSGAQGGDSWASVDQVFLSGQAAMAAYSSSDTSIYTDTGAENGFEVVASNLPYNADTGWTGNVIGGASLWLTAGLPEAEQDGALTFLLWFTNTENAADWAKFTGYIPIRLSSIELLDSEGFFETNPNHLIAPNQLADSQLTPATAGVLIGGLPAIRNVVTQAIDTVLLTDEDPQAVLDAAAVEANQIVSDYNTLNAPES
jgi:sn-glycerol 3-phosphate transport system substrate-binding protein